MNVVVLGGSGFIGSHIVEKLIQKGHKVRVFDREPYSLKKNANEIEQIIGDFGDPDKIYEAFADIDVIFHCISTSVPSSSNLDPVGDISNNLIKSIKLLEQMVKMGKKRIVFLSSGGAIYGNPEILPIPESHPLYPVSSYGIVKMAMERYLFMYQQLHGLRPIVIRPSNPYGPRQGRLGVQGIIGTFFHRLQAGEPLVVWGDGSVVRDYIYVEDLAELCVVAGETEVEGIFNCGSGKGLPIRELIKEISAVLGLQPKVNYEPGRAFDIHEVVLDISKAKEVFNWKPRTTLAEGLKKHWDWFLSQADRSAAK